MAIPKAERQAEAQMLGDTTKLAGSDPVAAALQGLGGAVQNVGQLVKQIEQVKDQGFALDAEAGRINAKSLGEANFAEMIRGGTKSIEEKGEFMSERMRSWSSGVSDGWKGSESALSSVMDKDKAAVEREQAGYRAEITKFELERSVVSHELGLKNAVYAGDQEKIDAIYSTYEAMVGPQRANNMLTDIQTSLGYDRNANLDSVSALRDAQKDMKSVAAWGGLPLIDEQTKGKIKAANRRNLQAMEKAHRDAQRERELDLTILSVNRRLSFEMIDEVEANGKRWDSMADPVGITKKEAMSLRGKLRKDIAKGIPEDVTQKTAAFAKALKKEFYFGPKEFVDLSSEYRLEKYKDWIADREYLDDNEKSLLFFNASKVYLNHRQPSVGQPVADAVAKMTQMEAKSIAGGVNLVIGENGYSFLTSIGDNPTPELIEQKANERYVILETSYNKALENELSLKPLGEPLEGDVEAPPTEGAKKAPDGLWYIEKNGQFFRVD